MSKELDDLASKRWTAYAEHQAVKGKEIGWQAAVEWLRKQAGEAFISHDDTLAVELRKLAAEMANEGTRRYEESMESTLRAAAEAESNHIAALNEHKQRTSQ